MPVFNCIRCGDSTYLDSFGYGGNFKGKLTCPKCGAVHITQMQSSNFLSLELAGFNHVRLPSTTPEDIRADYSDAQRCSQVEVYKGVVILCRRALQIAVEVKGSGKGNLKTQINKLAEQGVISPDIASLAHGIRFFGNYGSHPQDDDLKQITKLEAETTFSLTGQLLLRMFSPPSNSTVQWVKVT